MNKQKFEVELDCDFIQGKSISVISNIISKKLEEYFFTYTYTKTNADRLFEETLNKKINDYIKKNTDTIIEKAVEISVKNMMNSNVVKKQIKQQILQEMLGVIENE